MLPDWRIERSVTLKNSPSHLKPSPSHHNESIIINITSPVPARWCNVSICAKGNIEGGRRENPPEKFSSVAKSADCDVMCHIIHIIKIRISLEIVCGNLKVPVGTVGPEGLELPQQLLDAKAGPDDDDDDGDDDGNGDIGGADDGDDGDVDNDGDDGDAGDR